MTPNDPHTPVYDQDPRLSLRLRIWIACVAGGAIAGFGSLWVLGTRLQPDALDPADLLTWLSGVAFLAVLVGLVLAAWLEHHLVGHLRGLLVGVRTGRVAELRGLPGASGWGELSELSESVQELLAQQRRAAGVIHGIEQMREQVVILQRAVDRWLATETWEVPVLGAGPIADLADVLTRGLTRHGVVDEQNREAVRQVTLELSGSLADAHEAAEQAERGFVEATALLTTVRELQRLSGELQNAIGGLGRPAAAEPAAPPAPGGGDAPTREAIEELIVASQASVDSIGSGMLRVQDVAEQVQQLANRCTLIALHAITTRRGVAGVEPDEAVEELKRLAHDVRQTTDRTSSYAHDIETAVTEAVTRMREARERAIVRLDTAAAPPAAPAAPAPPAPPRALDDAQRLLERVREMVQDAARKGERLSAAGERASRAAERLARRLDDEVSEAEALVVRLAPVGDTAPVVHGPAPARLELLDTAAAEEPEPGDRAGTEERP